MKTTAPPTKPPPITKMKTENEDLATRINTIVHQCETRKNVRFSQASKDLIVATLMAITEDPSPRWQISSPGDFTLGYSKILGELPKMLEGLASREQETGVVTYFQVLHWLGINIDNLCPFPK